MSKSNIMQLTTTVRRMGAAVEAMKEAAEESLEEAKKARVRIRRQRIISTSSFHALDAEPESEEELTVPDSWREDEDTQKITLPEK